jgi:hypothetical protein
MKKISTVAAQEIEKRLTPPTCWRGDFSTGTRSPFFKGGKPQAGYLRQLSRDTNPSGTSAQRLVKAQILHAALISSACSPPSSSETCPVSYCQRSAATYRRPEFLVCSSDSEDDAF